MFLRAFAEAVWAPVAGRVALSLVFVLAGFQKLQGFDATVGYIGGLTNDSLALPLTVAAIVLELGGGLLLLINWRTEIALNALVIFIIVATILGHGDLSVENNITQILKNLAILGGLLIYSVHFFGQEPKEVTEGTPLAP